MNFYFTQLNHYLENSAKNYPDKIALMYEKEMVSYKKINHDAMRFAHQLKKIGLKPGDRVVVSVGNSIEAVIAFWGTLKAGCIISLIGGNQTEEKINFILKDSSATLWFGTEVQYHSIEKWTIDQPFRVKNFNEFIAESDDTEMKSPALDIDLAAIIYTSGSTGHPKGVMLTHRNMLAASMSITQYLQYHVDDVILCVMPISFDYGLYQMIMAFSVGATLILERDFFWPAQLLKKISNNNVTVLPVVPSMIPTLAKHSRHFPYILKSIRCVTNTGDILTLKHIEILKELFPRAELFSMYGLTECKRCTYLPSHMIDVKPTSVGIAIPNTELWIIDENGKKVGPKKIGQIVIRGATIMQGYWNQPNLTKKKLKFGIFPNEYCLLTGDYGWLDEDGYLYFHGRHDEMLKSRGIKVSPKEIESHLLQHPHVTEVAVLGKEDLELGTAIVAFVSGNNLSEKSLKQFVFERLSCEKRPTSIVILHSLPKLENGKIDKKSLQIHFFIKS
ncbi:MAG: hypothetical protein A3F10_00350 [Coxiella sp. RIFCSPHIGHO2_12_FULL_42_15]|nr:MAG: hypothetical protein A3F10_00350 [Coxiella sp. RIFCSPHIGHO2_12_FULL_42_15]